MLGSPGPMPGHTTLLISGARGHWQTAQGAQQQCCSVEMLTLTCLVMGMLRRWAVQHWGSWCCACTHPPAVPVPWYPLAKGRQSPSADLDFFAWVSSTLDLLLHQLLGCRQPLPGPLQSRAPRRGALGQAEAGNAGGQRELSRAPSPAGTVQLLCSANQDFLLPWALPAQAPKHPEMHRDSTGSEKKSESPVWSLSSSAAGEPESSCHTGSLPEPPQPQGVALRPVDP